MTPGTALTEFSTARPKLVTTLMLQITLIIALLAILPTFWPGTFSGLNPLHVDTDPENMLPHDAPVRVFHDNMKKEMALYDMVVLGIVNEEHPDGVFNPASLKKIYELTQYAKTLQWPDPDNPEQTVGVIEADMIAPSTVDNIEQGDRPGVVNFEWLMKAPPETPEGALAVRERAKRIPFLDGTLVSEDGKAICLYLPLTSKDMSSKVYAHLQDKIDTFEGPEEYHITGLPVAEDVFGAEMFKQMAISAPIAMVVIFLLMLLFFRNLVLVLSPMIVALVCVIMTMGLLVATGNTIHIMSSMIPIFIMPIAVLDAVHILSEFFDRYQETKDRRKTIIEVMNTLFMPMLYTTITTAVGFGSLALVPIPPVQVFGIFVVFGVIMAWLWTITFVPAYIMFIRPETLENFGTNSTEGEGSTLSRILFATGRMTFRHAGLIMIGIAVLTAGAIYGITLIRINDNPIKWFTKSHPIRVADRVLNEHFGGTYMAYLTLEADVPEYSETAFVNSLKTDLAEKKTATPGLAAFDTISKALLTKAEQVSKTVDTRPKALDQLEAFVDDKLFTAPMDQYDAWEAAMDVVAAQKGRGQPFKQPEVLRFIADLQSYLLKTGVVGKSNSLTDIVKTVRRELVSGKPADFTVPDSVNGVAQALLQYQNSHRPQDLWHLVTPDYTKSVMWVQLTSGDNIKMQKVVDAVKSYMASAEAPAGIRLHHDWFGLTYINVIWQQKMVNGMLNAFMGSFLVVFLMMTILYRSALWGLLSMIPLTVTILFIYGIIGWIGKDYDMPVAVLSALSLGLAVDYAIHFLTRSRMLYLEHGSWESACGPVFGEPALAISRNAIVIGVGFLPLLAAPLVPYKTVGIFIAAILVVAGLSSLLILPSLITLLEKPLFPKTRRWGVICNVATCIISAITLLGALYVNLNNFLDMGWTAMTWGSLIIIVMMANICYFSGKSRDCRIQAPMENKS
ncbi:MAG: MMPL family transporter [Thermodesulfobacteriota bacterium]|nr:MMPL family transporter [Thermodesulfobacteriota bacterium]